MYHVARILAVARRMQLAGLACLAASILVAACSTATAPASAAHALADQLATPRSAFSFDHRSRGTAVLDCVLANRSFSADVYADGSYRLRLDRGDIHLDATTAYLAGSLLRRIDDSARWLAVERAALPPIADELQRLFGLPVAQHLVTPGTPPAGEQVVQAALEHAEDVSAVEPLRTSAGEPLAGYRITVAGPDPVPVIDTWLDANGQVIRVQVQDSLGGEPGTPNPDTGWIIDYGAEPTGEPAAPPAPATITADELATATAPVNVGCDLPVADEPTGEPVPP